jgi:hypothetical protein
MKVYATEDELWPDFVPVEPAERNSEYAEWQEQYAVDVPELLWKEYLYARREYLELKDKVMSHLDSQNRFE